MAAVQVNRSLSTGEVQEQYTALQEKKSAKRDELMDTSHFSSAEQRFTTHTPPASDESHNGDDTAGHQNTAHPVTTKDIDDGSSELSELDFENEEHQDTVMEGIESIAPEQDPKDDIYANVEPAEWSGKIPIFKPDMAQFADFEKFMNAINHYGMQSGIVLVDPPQTWKDSRRPLDQQVKSVLNRRPIKQEFVKYGSTFGCFKLQNIEKQRNYNLPQWRAVCDDINHQPPAPRGQARTAANPKPVKTTAPKQRSTPVPLASGQKRRAGRPRVHAMKEDTPSGQGDSDSAALGPPTPTSPKVKPDDSVDAETEEKGQETTPSKRKGRPPKSAKTSKATKPKQPSKPKDSSGDMTTSVTARRKHNEGAAVHEIDEEAFKNFDYRIHNHGEYTPERCSELERRYWQGLMYADPMYGADMPGSLFEDDDKIWNVANLPNLLDVIERKIPGVNTAYLYLGMWKATFTWHLEDMDLYSINYIHFGAPKQWYSISQNDLPKFESVMREMFPQDAKNCDQFLRHKSFLVSPELLEKRGVYVNRVVHREGQFVITYPMGYHSGYNLGYNCAESVNFALDAWLQFAEKAKKCECESDSVFIDFAWLMRRINKEPTPEFDYEEIEISDDEDDADAAADLPTPPRSVKGQSKAGQKRKRGAPVKEKKKKKIRIAIKKHQPCVLCPNDFDWEPLLPTAEGKKAHRRCADYHLETYICKKDGQETVFGIENINKERSKLRCSYCHISRGTCFQCHSAKCVKPFHGTCAVLAGVQVDEGESCFSLNDIEYKSPVVDLRCKLHRTVKSNARDESHAQELDAMPVADNVYEFASRLKENDVVQFQRIKGDDVRAAIVKAPLQKGDKTVFVEVLPKGSNMVSLLDIDSLLFVDESTSSFHPPAPTAIPMPPELAHELLGSTSTAQTSEDNKKPTAGDTFWDSVDGSQKLEWAEFSDLAPAEKVKNPAQKKIKLSEDLEKEEKLFHYLPALSTETKDFYSINPKNKTADPRANPDTPQKPATSATTTAGSSFSTTFARPYVPRPTSTASSTPTPASTTTPLPRPVPSPYMRTPMSSGPRPYQVAPNAVSYNGPIFPYSPLNPFSAHSAGARPLQTYQSPQHSPPSQTTPTFPRPSPLQARHSQPSVDTLSNPNASSIANGDTRRNSIEPSSSRDLYSFTPSYLAPGTTPNGNRDAQMSPNATLNGQGQPESLPQMHHPRPQIHTDHDALRRLKEFQSKALSPTANGANTTRSQQSPITTQAVGQDQAVNLGILQHQGPIAPAPMRQSSGPGPGLGLQMNSLPQGPGTIRSALAAISPQYQHPGMQPQFRRQSNGILPPIGAQTTYPTTVTSAPNVPSTPSASALRQTAGPSPIQSHPLAPALLDSEPYSQPQPQPQHPWLDGNSDPRTADKSPSSGNDEGSTEKKLDTLGIKRPRGESGKWVRDWLADRSPEQVGEILGEGGPGLPMWWEK